MNDNRLKIRACFSGGWGGIELRLFKNDKVAKDIVYKKTEIGRYIEPVEILTKDQAQVLMDDLWTAGIRPTEGSGSAGSLKATQDHLEDMRKIAFNRLKI